MWGDQSHHLRLPRTEHIEGLLLSIFSDIDIYLVWWLNIVEVDFPEKYTINQVDDLETQTATRQYSLDPKPIEQLVKHLLLPRTEHIECLVSDIH